MGNKLSHFQLPPVIFGMVLSFPTAFEVFELWLCLDNLCFSSQAKRRGNCGDAWCFRFAWAWLINHLAADCVHKCGGLTYIYGMTSAHFLVKLALKCWRAPWPGGAGCRMIWQWEKGIVPVNKLHALVSSVSAVYFNSFDSKLVFMPQAQNWQLGVVGAPGLQAPSSTFALHKQPKLFTHRSTARRVFFPYICTTPSP